MPFYTYKVKEKQKGCGYCRGGFELMQKICDAPLVKCPECGCGVEKIFGGFELGHSKTGFDRNAKEKGFHKLKKVDKGKYEKLY